MIEEAISEGDGVSTVKIEVVPNSKRPSVSWDEWRKRIKLKITSKAQKGKANEEVLSFFGEVGSSRIVSGHLNKEKVIEISASKGEVLDHLHRHMTSFLT